MIIFSMSIAASCFALSEAAGRSVDAARARATSQRYPDCFGFFMSRCSLEIEGCSPQGEQPFGLKVP